MKPTVLTALLLALPLAAGAQAIRCTDPATGKVLYTDQPCKNGALVVPKRTEEELRQDAQAAQEARERRAEQREQAAQAREAQRREAALIEAARPPAPASPAETAECRAARADADFRARSNTATAEQIRTARYNAALACGQQPPADVIVVQPEPWGAVPPHRRPPPGYGWGQGAYTPPVDPQRPPRPSYSGGTQDNRAIPIAPVRPAVAPSPSQSGGAGVSAPRGNGASRTDDSLPVAPVR